MNICYSDSLEEGANRIYIHNYKRGFVGLAYSIESYVVQQWPTACWLGREPGRSSAQ
jgi:hypothetical protein